MKEMPLVSIIMPAYNAERTITNSIKSVLTQTYSRWELIIIDDGSSDATYTIIQDLISVDSRILLIKNKQNVGVSESRNKGIHLAKGDWIAFLDSDDCWVPTKLDKQIRILQEKPEIDLIYTGSMFFDNLGKKSTYQLRVPRTISYHELLKKNVISCSSVLVKKKLLLEYPMKMDEMHEDYAVWLQIIRDGKLVYGIDEPLIEYRVSKKSKSGNKRKAARMTYRVYRFMGLNQFQALYYFSFYIWRSIKKYFCIRCNKD